MNELPRQKVPSSAKSKKWFKDCIVNGVNLALNEENSIKPTNETIRENFKLYDGETDARKLKERFVNDMLKDNKLNPSFDHFSTIKNRIDELVGEFIEMGTEYVIAAINPDSVSSKIEERKSEAVNFISSILQSKVEDIDEVMAKVDKFVSINYISRAEIAANRVLSYLKKVNRLSYLEYEGFREALITAVAVFYVGIEHKRFVVRKSSPESIYAVRNGYSNDIKDAEMIAEVFYYPRGKVVDKYTDVLTNSEIDRILSSSFALGGKQEEDKKSMTFNTMDEMNRFTNQSMGTSGSQDIIDEYGNIRVVKLSWKGFRKIFIRKYYDNNGDPQEEFVSDKYKVDKDKGEVLTPLWIAEWHEGDLIGGDIIANARVREVQLRDENNPFESTSGYVGGFFNVGMNKAKSLIDLVKPYLYFRDILFARIEDVLASNIGKIVTVDLSKLPDGWSLNKWYGLMKIHKIKVIDSFKESQKGASTGKLAGQFNPSTRPEDLDTSSSIGFYLELIRFVDEMIAKVTGVTEQRLGTISSRELVGNVERSRIQSSLVTEIWFKRYEQILLDLYSLMLDTSKLVLDTDSRLQTVLDDFSYVVLKSLKDFKSTTFGLFPVNTRKFDKLKSLMEQIAINAVPNGQMTPSQLIELYRSDSVFSMIEKQKELEVENLERKEEEAKVNHERTMEQITANSKAEEGKLILEKDLDYKIAEMKEQYGLKIAEMNLLDKAKSDAFKASIEEDRDVDNDGIDDNVEIVKQRMINEQKDKELAVKRLEISKKYSQDKQKK